MTANDKQVIELCIKIIAEKSPQKLARLAAQLERISPLYDRQFDQERSTDSGVRTEVGFGSVMFPFRQTGIFSGE